MRGERREKEETKGGAAGWNCSATNCYCSACSDILLLPGVGAGGTFDLSCCVIHIESPRPFYSQKSLIL